MLVLSRGIDQTILIDECVRVVVCHVSDEVVGLNVKAPLSFRIEHPARAKIHHTGSTIPVSKQEMITIYEVPRAHGDRSPSEQACVICATRESWAPEDRVEVRVIDVRDDKVRLGIDAPRWMTICREEVYLAIKREQD